MRDIHRPPKQPAQRANSKTPPSHSKPPSHKIAQLQYSKAEVKVIKGQSSSGTAATVQTPHIQPRGQTEILPERRNLKCRHRRRRSSSLRQSSCRLGWHWDRSRHMHTQSRQGCWHQRRLEPAHRPNTIAYYYCTGDLPHVPHCPCQGPKGLPAVPAAIFTDRELASASEAVPGWAVLVVTWY
jgi:hypothetical protein